MFSLHQLIRLQLRRITIHCNCINHLVQESNKKRLDYLRQDIIIFKKFATRLHI